MATAPAASVKDQSPSKSQSWAAMGESASAEEEVKPTGCPLTAPAVSTLKNAEGGTLAATAKLRVIQLGSPGAEGAGPLSWLDPQTTLDWTGSGDAPA